ncbi:MAG: DUF1311 domain-containing protein, partial [Alphaproteobacteria bacterium]|nr:DUF1311 domain-containing protein [Alphaproteobacteria bacterium]
MARRLVAAAFGAALWSGAAGAQDCARIAAIPDRLICANEEVRAADAAMAGAYRALRERLDGGGRERLLAAQRAWLALRNRACETRNELGDDAKASCLIAMTGRRRAALEAGRAAGELIVGPEGAPRLAVETQLLGDPGRRCTVVARVLRFADADRRAAAFDQAVRRAVFGAGFAGCAARNRNFDSHDYDVDVVLSWFDARVLAVAFETYLDPGNARPQDGVANVVFDLRRGRVLTRDDLVAGPAALAAIAEACFDALRGDPAVGADDINRAIFERRVRDFAAWTIAPESITIRFPRFTIQGGVAPGTACILPLDAIRPHLRAD